MAREFQTANDGFSITPGAALFAKPAEAIYVGVAGDVTLETPEGTSLTFTAVAGGMILFRAVKVTAATAGGLIGALQY